MPEPATAPTTEAAPGTRRLNLNLTPQAADDLETIVRKSGKSMTEIIRLGLGLAKLATEVTENKQKLVIADSSGKPIKEVLIPG